MKYCIFSDVHSNYEALSTFLRITDSLEDVRRICLGDVVGYGSSPNECVEMLDERRIPVVMGNHDYGILDLKERENFNLEARKALEWQDSILKPYNRKRVEIYPFVYRVNKWLSVTHSNFSYPAKFIYIFTIHDALDSLESMKTEIGFFGHTHVPTVFVEDRIKGARKRVTSEIIRGNHQKIHLDEGKKYLINPGSLGQPRDGDPRASYVMLDFYENTITFHRLLYDSHRESCRMLEAQLPETLAMRILIGF